MAISLLLVGRIVCSRFTSHGVANHLRIPSFPFRQSPFLNFSLNFGDRQVGRSSSSEHRRVLPSTSSVNTFLTRKPGTRGLDGRLPTSYPKPDILCAYPSSSPHRPTFVRFQCRIDTYPDEDTERHFDPLVISSPFFRGFSSRIGSASLRGVSIPPLRKGVAKVSSQRRITTRRRATSSCTRASARASHELARKKT